MEAIVIAVLALVTSLGAAAVDWLARQRAASHRAEVDKELVRLEAELGRESDERKAELDQEQAVLIAGLQSESRRLQSELDVTYDALSRLRSATGPLRLELFLSTRSVIRRLETYRKKKYELDAEEKNKKGPYHDCGLLIYRLLRPIAVSSLIEPTMYFRDLSIDDVTMDFLDFNHAAIEMLTGERIGYYPETTIEIPGFDMEKCWLAHSSSHPAAAGPRTYPFQRLRSSYLKSAADALLLPTGMGESPGVVQRKRCMSHADFLERWEDPDGHADWHAKIDSLKHFMHQFRPENDPIAWLRLVGYGHVCKWFFYKEADRAAIEDPERRKHFRVQLDVKQMIEAGGSQHINQYAEEYPAYFDQIIEDAL